MPININILKKYLNPVFIETGSFLGNGIQSAIDAGFKKIYSIELSMELYERCKKRFKDNNNVYLKQGDSSIVLNELLKGSSSDANNNITYWLDGHYSGGSTVKGNINSPIINELEIIKKYYKAGDIILIDDIRLCTDLENELYDFECNPKDLENKLLEINPNFQLEYIDSYRGNTLMFQKDILVAR